MALFERKPVVSNSLPLYSIGAQKSLLIIGLGNPGQQYSQTRHNIGFEVLDYFASKNDVAGWQTKKDLDCQIAIATIASTRVILCKPTTFMNRCGVAAQKVQSFYKLSNRETLAIYDELAVPFGSIRARTGGSDAGHNGVKSLIELIGNEFSRLRIGIGSEYSSNNTADFVLKPFSVEEKKAIEMVIKEASAMVQEFIASGSLPHETRSII